MRVKIILLLALLFSLGAQAQEYDFSFLQGLKKENGDIFFEMSGYLIIVKTYDKSINSRKDLDNIKKKLHFKDKITAEYEESTIPVPNRIWEMEKMITDNHPNKVCYLLSTADNKTTVIYFSTVNQRDTVFEQVFVKEWLVDELKDFVSNNWMANEVFFCGEWIRLGNACRWQNPHDIQHFGERISWSEFPSLQEAKNHKDLLIERAKNDPLVHILSEENIEVSFRGVKTIAQRIVFRQEKAYYRHPIVVYYIAEEVNGYYISCITSRTGVNRNDYELNYLLEVFMEIPEYPVFAWNPLDYIEYEPVPESLIADWEDRVHLFDFRAGAWFPLGRSKQIARISPSFKFSMGFPINNRFALDLLMGVTAPIKSKEFTFYDNNVGETTKATTLFELGIRFRHQHKLAKKLFLTTYAGIAYAGLQTDLEDEDSKKNNESYETVGAPDLSGGISLRYRNVGLYTEYHYIPYSYNKHVHNRSLGNSSIQVGVSYSF